MSGGRFDYQQYRITEIADSVEGIIKENGQPKSAEELRYNPEWYEQYPEDKVNYKYPDAVIEEFKKGLQVLREAAIYAQRIDWLLSGDDGEESFLKRLKEELQTIPSLAESP